MEAINQNQNTLIKNYLEDMIQSNEKKLEDRLVQDSLPKNLKFGEFNIECDDDSYTISQTFYINDELNNKKEMIDISQLLNNYYEDKK